MSRVCILLVLCIATLASLPVRGDAPQATGSGEGERWREIQAKLNAAKHARLAEEYKKETDRKILAAQRTAAPLVDYKQVNFGLPHNVTHIVTIQLKRVVGGSNATTPTTAADSSSSRSFGDAWSLRKKLKSPTASLSKEERRERLRVRKQAAGDKNEEQEVRGVDGGANGRQSASSSISVQASADRDNGQSAGDVEHTYGDVRIALFGDNVPKTVENFRALCTGEHGYGYEGSLVHRIVYGAFVQLGDFTSHDGFGGHSIYGRYFDDESFALKHYPGSVSMANRGPNTNGAQFYFSVGAQSSMDNQSVVFGHVIEGYHDVIRRLASPHTPIDATGTPRSAIYIAQCRVMDHHKGDRQWDFATEKAKKLQVHGHLPRVTLEEHEQMKQKDLAPPRSGGVSQRTDEDSDDARRRGGSAHEATELRKGPHRRGLDAPPLSRRERHDIVSRRVSASDLERRMRSPALDASGGRDDGDSESGDGASRRRALRDATAPSRSLRPAEVAEALKFRTDEHLRRQRGGGDASDDDDGTATSDDGARRAELKRKASLLRDLPEGYDPEHPMKEYEKLKRQREGDDAAKQPPSSSPV